MYQLGSCRIPNLSKKVYMFSVFDHLRFASIIMLIISLEGIKILSGKTFLGLLFVLSSSGSKASRMGP